MRTRLAITAMLVVGFALSGAGAGLAVSGISGDDTSSSSAAYNQPTQGQTTLTPDTTTPTTQQIVPTGTETPQPPAPAPDQGLLGEEESGSAPDEAAAPGEEAEVTPQETRQLAAQPGGDELPFTGWAAIPVLLIGLALVGGGVVMRKSIARKSS